MVTNNQIVILLIDDEPEFCGDGGIVSLSNGVPYNVDTLVSQNFVLIWLKSLKEIRWYIDSLKLIKSQSSQRLASSQLLPDVIVFDYCLTRGRGRMERSHNQDSLPKDVVDQLLSESEAAPPSFAKDIPELENAGDDRAGLVAGLTVFQILYDNYTAGIPITQHPELGESPNEFGVMEWILNEEIDFANKLGIQKDWLSILSVAMPDLRRRIVQMVSSGHIMIDPAEIAFQLKQLQDQPEVFYNDIVSRNISVVHPTYGGRILPLGGLIFDCIDHTEGADRNRAVLNASELFSFYNKLLAASGPSACSPKLVAAKARIEGYLGPFLEDTDDVVSVSLFKGIPTDDERALHVVLAAFSAMHQCDDVFDTPESFENTFRSIFFPDHQDWRSTSRALSRVSVSKGVGLRLDHIWAKPSERANIFSPEHAELLDRLHASLVRLNGLSLPHWWAQAKTEG